MVTFPRSWRAASVLTGILARWTSRAGGGTMPAVPTDTNALPVYWTPSRAAEELGVHRQTIHDWMAAGKLTPVAVAHETRERIVYLFAPDDVRRVAAATGT